MATGGQNPNKDVCSNSELANGNGHGDRVAPWTLLPNNLELNTRSKPAKKQRNKDKSRGSASQSPSVFSDSLFQSVSDADNPSGSERNIKPTKPPVNLRAHSSNFPGTCRTAMENENRPVKEQHMNKRSDAIQSRFAHLKECQAQVNSVLQQLENSGDPHLAEQISTMKGIQADLADKEIMLRNYAKQVYDVEQMENKIPSYANPPDILGTREVNGVQPFFNEEDAANIQNHLQEKVKASQEKLVSLREHKSFLMSMRKKAEDSLAAFEAHVAEMNEKINVQNEQECHFPPQQPHNSCTSNKVSVNGECRPDKELFPDPAYPWPSRTASKSGLNDTQSGIENEWDSQDLPQFQVNLDHIKKRLEVLQQLYVQSGVNTDGKNENSLSMMEDVADNATLNRRAAIECERLKLTNTLAELQEKQKLNETLKKRLLFLKDAATALNLKEEENSFPPTNVEDPSSPCSEENENTVADLCKTLDSLKRMLEDKSKSASNGADYAGAPANIAPEPQQSDIPSKLPSNTGIYPKRDNIRKEQRNQFPARRHYEAEGRANEDPDVPMAPPIVATPSPDPNAWENDVRLQEKKKELENTKKKLKMMQNLVTTIQDARASGQQIPSELLHLLSSFKEDNIEDDEDEDEEVDEEIDFDDNTVTDNEDSQENEVSVKNKPLDSSTTRVKECSNDVTPRYGEGGESDRTDVAENMAAEAQNFELLVLERERLLKLQEKFLELQKKFTSTCKQNNELMRYSGEGGNQDKKTRQVLSSTSAPPVRRQRQDNLLTRQNVESQNRNNSANMSKASSMSLKKDNINDLSAKLIKPAPAQVSADSLNKYNSAQSFSYSPDLRQKSVLEDILKHGKNKPQNYARRDNHVHSNSSINSEPLDSSSRSFAPDTTAAATWGGSSTQENFEDDNEPESLGDQEDDDEDGNNNEAAGNINRPAESSFNQYHRRNETYATYSDSSAKRRDNRLQKYFKSTQLNQWPSKKNFTQPEAICNRNQNVPSPSEFSADQVQENTQLPTAGAPVNPMPMPNRFVRQLQEQLDKLNALCRPVLHDQPPPPQSSEPSPSTVTFQTPINSEINASTYPTSNSCRPSQNTNEIMQLYMQQLQLQQQLLLSLSPCYHALYIQQLEIQHLSRCLQQNPESDNPSQQLPNTPSTLLEDFTFRPWFFPPWLNPGITPMPFGPGQVSPVGTAPFLPPTQQPFSYAQSVASTNPPSTAPCALVTGVQPARAVVHPDRQNVETLNNQVPPRTRANNFWDNFRSQSRQNLLSSNTTRNKDSPGHFNSPQVRQVNPVIPNESSWTHRSRVFIPPHTENNPSISHSSDRTFSRPPTDSSFRIACRAKKPNWSRQTAPPIPVIPDSTSSSANRFNVCPETNQVFPSNSNSNSDQTQSSEMLPTPFGNRPELRFLQPRPRPSAPPANCSGEPSFDAVQSEISRILVQNDSQSGYLMELLREVRNLKSDSLQKALNAVRELVNSESGNNAEAVENFENANQIATHENSDSKDENSVEPGFASALPSYDSLPSKSSNENSCQRSNHNWPPATIIPLGKHVPKACTGAVKKRPLSDAVMQPSRAWPQATTSAIPENEAPQSLRSESLEATVSRIIQSILPFIQSHVTEDCTPAFRMNFCSRVIDIIKINSNFKLSPECLLQLHSALLHMLNRFSNFKLMDCQGELIKHLGSTLYRELDAYRAVSFRQNSEENCDPPATVSKKSAQPDLLPSSKPVCDMNKQVLATKDERTEEIEYDDVFGNTPMQEYENQIGQLFISMPTEESVLPSHLNGSSIHESIRGVISGACSPLSNNWPTQAVNAEEDMGYECEPEAEGQPEVEASTEADLAEADQSPGQQGSSSGSGTAAAAATIVSNDTWHAVSQPSCITRTVAASNGINMPTSNSIDDVVLAENACFVEASGILGLSSQVPTSSNVEKEIGLDDIPTKLTPLSEEELQKQMAEEQETNSLLLEVVEDVPLARNGDCPKDPPPPPYV